MNTKSLFNALTVYNTKNKVRLGPKSDGGYVIKDGLSYDLMISAGVGDNNDFDIEILNKNENLIAFTFDATIDKLPKTHKNLYFVKKNIGTQNNKTTTNLNKYIKSFSNIFLAMDIEGAEYNWLNSITIEQLKKFKQIVIEIHQPIKINAKHNVSVENRIKALTKLTKTHNLIHFHPNNCCGIRKIDGIVIPNVYEATYIRKGETEIVINTDPIPSSLDYKNVLEKDDILLSGPPYQFITHQN